MDLGLAHGIDAQVFGQPGERTFKVRILGSGDAGSASLWMEKEQVHALGLALSQILAQVSGDQSPAEPEMDGFSDPARIDFKVGKMAVGYDSSDQTVVIQAFEIGVEDEDSPGLTARIRRDHCVWLAPRLLEIVAAGRPQCPLCGRAMDATGHVCIRGNGHYDEPLPEAGSDDVPGDEI